MVETHASPDRPAYPCPAWCAQDHAPHAVEVAHDAPAQAVALTVPLPDGTANLLVAATRRDDEHGGGLPFVVVSTDGDEAAYLTADEAVQLATYLLVAAADAQAA